MHQADRQHKNLQSILVHINELMDKQALISTLVTKQQMRRREQLPTASAPRLVVVARTPCRARWRWSRS